MRVTLTEDKIVNNLLYGVLTLTCQDRPTVRETARVIGKCIAALPGARFGPLYYRALERDKINAQRVILIDV